VGLWKKKSQVLKTIQSFGAIIRKYRILKVFFEDFPQGIASCTAKKNLAFPKREKAPDYGLV
jgi:hypothetical protein